MKMTDAGHEVKLLTSKTVTAQAAGTIATPWVDIKQDTEGPFDSLLASASIGAATGSPTSQTLVLKFQDADDSSGTGAADYKPDGTNVAQSVAGISGVVASSNNTCCQLSANGSHARRYVRAVATLAFPDGTSPTQQVAVHLHAAGGRKLPVTQLNA